MNGVATSDARLRTPVQAGLPVLAITGSWHALWTRSHCEQAVYEDLSKRDLHAFLPTVSRWSTRRGVRRLVHVPMFPGYLFVRHVMDKAGYLEVSRTRGVVRILGDRWDRLATIPDDEVAAIERVSASDEPIHSFPYLTQGQRARITRGPLAGVEGVFVEARPRQHLLVLSVHLLQRSVAVVVDGDEVMPLP